MVNKKGEILKDYTIKGQHYTVIRTRVGQQNSVWYAIDTIKNMTTGTIKTMTRKEWCELFNKFN